MVPAASSAAGQDLGNSNCNMIIVLFQSQTDLKGTLFPSFLWSALEESD